MDLFQAIPPIECRSGDKIEHAIGGALIQAIAETIVHHMPAETPRAVRYAVLTIPLVGIAVGKEVYDHQHPDRHDCDVHDAMATVGGGLAVSLAIHLRW